MEEYTVYHAVMQDDEQAAKAMLQMRDVFVDAGCFLSLSRGMGSTNPVLVLLAPGGMNPNDYHKVEGVEFVFVRAVTAGETPDVKREEEGKQA